MGTANRSRMMTIDSTTVVAVVVVIVGMKTGNNFL